MSEFIINTQYTLMIFNKYYLYNIRIKNSFGRLKQKHIIYAHRNRIQSGRLINKYNIAST